MGRLGDWRARERFAEYGARDAAAVTRRLARLVEQAPGRLWDGTKVRRSGKHVWGTCTSHEYTARCPDRATAVRAHNWAALGALLENPGQPAWSLPQSGRLYFRQSQLPRLSPTSGRREPFRTECELAVELVREQARIVGGRHLAAFDGGYALKSVVRPLVAPEGGRPRIEFLTGLRYDARPHAVPPPERCKGQRGPMPKWGRRLPPPRRGGRRTRGWHEGHAFIYGRQRKVTWKEAVGLWRVSGHDVPVKAVVAKVEGYTKRFTRVTAATELTGLRAVESFAARFRQEDGFRDLNQRLGWEACRAWARNPIERASQAQWVAMSPLRLVQFRLDAEGCVDWWTPPPWNRTKDRPSVLDAERLLRRHRPEIQPLRAEWLGDEGGAA